MSYRSIIWRQRRRKEKRDKRKRAAIYLLILLIGIVIGRLSGPVIPVMADTITPEQMIDTGELYKVECTAYSNEEGNLTATGQATIEGLTVAGAPEWLGCTCILYDEDMNFIGYYEFTDTGYGRDGDIQRGETIDLYFSSTKAAREWGRKNAYIQIIRADG